MQSFIFQFIVKVTSWLNLKNAQKWAAFVARLIWRWSEKQRRITLTNIRLCYPELNAQQQIELAQSSLKETIKSMFELGNIWQKDSKSIDQLIQNIHGLDVFESALNQNKGLLLAAPHFGNWEVLNLWLSKQPGFSFLYKPPTNPKIEQLLLKYRGSGGANQITADAKGVRKIFKVLNERHILAILPDQQPKNGQGVYAPFMGQSAYTMTLFSKIALKTKVPVIFAVAERLADGKGFDLHFKLADKTIYENLEASVSTVNKTIEDMVKIAPNQYQWTYKRFSIQADGSKPYRKHSG